MLTVFHLQTYRLPLLNIEFVFAKDMVYLVKTYYFR